MNPLSPHPTPAELADYAARRLAAAEVLRLSDHLAGCAACREAAARVRRPTDGPPVDFLRERDDEIPGFDELAGEIDGTLTPAQHDALAARLEASPAAREALADLAAFRDELAGLPTKFHGPRGTAGGAGDSSAEADKVITPPRWRWRGGRSRLAGLAALFVALAVGWWVFARPGQDAAGLLRGTDGQPANLAGLPAGLREAVEAAARTGALPPLGTGPGSRREVLAGATAGPAMAVVSPVGGVVRATRPPLRWTPRAGATGYTVYLAPAGGVGPLVSSPLLPATSTQWTPPEALARGAVYEWQVEALRGTEVMDRAPKPPAGEARFEVLDAARDAGLTQAEKQAADNPLVLGVAYWRAGLPGAAADQFHRLAQAHAQSAAAQRLERTADGAVADTAK